MWWWWGSGLVLASFSYICCVAAVAEVLEWVTEKLVSSLQPKAVVLFGSYARGEQTDESDLDILVVKENLVDKTQDVINARWALRGAGIPIDLLFASSDSLMGPKNGSSILTQILNEGKVLFGGVEY